MTTNKVIYETGATSHAVNDLILFTDNTRVLAEIRDDIYSLFAKVNREDIFPTASVFTQLFESARRHYINESQYSGAGHIIRMSKAEIKEYCTLYANDFENWKQEHKIC